MSTSEDNLPDLTGAKVALAGTFDDLGRMEARLGLERLGATVVKELDATLDYVAAGIKGGPKLAQALALGIAHLDEATLVALLARDAQKTTAAAADGGPRLPRVEGAVVILAGSLAVMGRPEAKRQLERLGAIVTEKLDAGVSFVVAGAKGGPTLFNAKQLGIPQIDEPTLQALVAQLPEEEDTAGVDGPPVLAGAVVVMAGIPSAMGRPQALRRLQKLGATVADRVDRSVKFVFVCQGGASTLFQAKELGIRELDEATLMELVADVSDDAEDSTATSGPGVEDLVGKKVLIAGALQQVGRAEARKKLTHLGAEVVDQLSDDVAYVVAGKDGGRNLFLAKQARTPLITEPLLLTLLAQAPEVAVATGPTVPGPEALGGVRLVLAGQLPQVDRVQAKRKLASRGAQVVAEVDAEVTLVFAGKKGGRNVLVAMQRSLPVFDEDALVGLLNQIPDPEPGGGSGSAGAQTLPDLRGRTVLLTGKLQQLDRRDALDRLRRLGATLMNRVEDGPDFVIVGDRGGRAEFVARQESIPVLDEATLLAILEKAGADD